MHQRNLAEYFDAEPFNYPKVLQHISRGSSHAELDFDRLTQRLLMLLIHATPLHLEKLSRMSLRHIRGFCRQHPADSATEVALQEQVKRTGNHCWTLCSPEDCKSVSSFATGDVVEPRVDERMRFCRHGSA